ncbi:MAG: DegT/DnrJ/EryC1/StrS family aminotransferase [Planctomycetaceae bacterium]|nr:DegT/DnrJ/EryC1/StrS family aminotransferase [Planctomycetaceae bacterium]
MKSAVRHFAAFGGRPIFERPLHVGAPNVIDTESLVTELRSVLMSGTLTNNGPRVREFESVVAAMTNSRNCVATCNATVALQIVARAMDLTGEVILPSFTFIATAHAMQWVGLTPVFADVDPVSHTLCPVSAAQCISARTSALLPVHLWGNSCDVESLSELAERHNLKLFFDASHAFNCRRNQRPIGTFGQAEVFSFHATKFVHAVEGGAIVTNNDELAERCRMLRSFGFSCMSEVSDVGTNAKMNELCAAVGLKSLDLIDLLQSINRRNQQSYRRHLSGVSGVRLIDRNANDFTNGQYVVLMIDENAFGLSRDQVIRFLRAEGIFARAYFSPGCHRAEPYCRSALHTPVPLPITEQLAANIMQLPTGSALGNEQIQAVCHLLQRLHRQRREVSREIERRGGQLASHPHDPLISAPLLREAA